MDTERFAYVWQFTVNPKYRAEFLMAYRPNGDWANLFERDPDYIETKLLKDHDHEDRYVTIDYWTSKGARDAFRERFAIQFRELDERCQNFTLDEVFIGDYVTVGCSAT
jgi:hypothetical protein